MKPENALHLLVVDPSVSQYTDLLVDLPTSYQVLVLDGETDGLSQLSKAIAHSPQLASIHILSHGTPGEVYLGTLALNRDTLLQRAEEVMQWSDHLTPDAELFLYGCRVAANDAGVAFVDLLAELTGMAIAASPTLTGASTLGGRWDLAYQTRPCNTPIPISPQAQRTYAGVLDPIFPNILYGSNNAGEIFAINPEDGTSTRVGQLEDAGGNEIGTFAIARESITGRVYFIENTSPNARVGFWDPFNQTTTVLQTITTPGGRFFRMAQSQAGIIYAINEAVNDLFTVDENTGAITDLGPIGNAPGNAVNFVTSSGDMAFDPTNADRLIISSAPGGSGPLDLFEVDVTQSPLQAVYIGRALPTTEGGIGSLAYGQDGQLYTSAEIGGQDGLYRLELTGDPANPIITTLQGQTVVVPGNADVQYTDFGSLPTPTPEIDIEIVASGALQPTVEAGETITFSLNVTNTDPVFDVENISFVSTLPPELTTISWTSAITSGTGTINSGGSGTGNQLTSGISLNANSTVTFNVEATVAPGTPEDTRIRVIASANLPPGINDSDPDDNIYRDLTRVVAPGTPTTDIDIATGGTLVPTVEAGEAITFTLTVSNTDAQNNVNNLGFVSELPAELTNVSWTSSVSTGTGTITLGGNGSGNLINSRLNLNAGAVATFRVRATVAPGTPEDTRIRVISRANLPAGTTDSNPNNNIYRDLTRVVAAGTTPPVQPPVQPPDTTCRPGLNLTGTLANDILQGTNGRDVLRGIARNDVLNGLNCPDRLFGGAGRDTLRGGNANDLLSGQPGRDSLSGGLGNDTLYGGGQIDTLVGNAGNDFLAGEGGNDRLLGGAGRDSLFGGNGADLLEGGGDNDILDGGLNSDTIQGEAGNDNIRGRRGNDLISGGAGRDTIAGDGSRDRLFGNAGNDLLQAGTGRDSVFGGAGSDTIFGNADSDVLSGGSGVDRILAGLGNDLVRAGAGNDNVNGNQGNDRLFGDAGNDDMFGAAGSDTLSGGDGSDTLGGGTFGDVLRGDAGNDLIRGGLGADEIFGGTGNDRLSGNLGRDLIVGNAGNDRIFGNDGSDEAQGGVGDDFVDGGKGADFLSGQAGNDRISGGRGQDSLFGGTGDDLLQGGSTQDLVVGGAGNDRVTGNGGKDIVQGNAGNDRIIGGPGRDIVRGGSGADLFLFNQAEVGPRFIHSAMDASDRVLDFNQTEGDRFRVIFASGSRLPSALTHAGRVSGGNIRIAARNAYRDTNRQQAGQQGILPEQAVFFEWRQTTYLAVNDNNRIVNPFRDQVFRTTDIVFAPGDATQGALNVAAYFA